MDGAAPGRERARPRWGAETRAGDATRFRLWAPDVDSLGLSLRGDGTRPMRREAGGWWAVEADAPPGTRYRFVLPDGLAVSDPASRLQEGGVHGWSVVTGPDQYAWENAAWRGRPWHEAVIYELHPGLMGGFDGIRRRLPELRDLGVTAVELMPIAEFPGSRNWGYDGTLNFAPSHNYGTPDELKRLVDEAHGLDLCVMFDVVYNHFGPDGNYLGAYCSSFFRQDAHTPWGIAIDFRRPEVMAFFAENALHWLHEYRVDGLRFDALHAVIPQDALLPLERAIRTHAPDRTIWLVMEHGENVAHLVQAEPGAPGYDAQWADDFHHAMHVLLTGERSAYYADFDRPTHQLARILAEGFALQGEHSRRFGRPVGEPSRHLPTSSFVMHLQNHDQIGNRAYGDRLPLLTSPAKLRAATALLLLSPFIPLMFMGDEWATSAPFLFFTDHGEDLARKVREGRARDYGFPPGELDRIPDPNAPGTFEACRVEPTDPAMRELYQALLRLRRTHVAPGIPGARSLGSDVLGPAAVAARWRLGTGAELAILLNIGNDGAAAAPPEGVLLHESAPGAARSLQDGELPPESFTAFLVETRV